MCAVVVVAECGVRVTVDPEAGVVAVAVTVLTILVTVFTVAVATDEARVLVATVAEVLAVDVDPC